jgi:hypothetical protein
MTKTTVGSLVLALGLYVGAPVAQEKPVRKTAGVPGAAELERMSARFVPTDISADLSRLSPTDRQVLGKLIAASRIMDALFLRQVWSGNEAMLIDLARDTSPEGLARLRYFLINKGPWSRLDHDQAFVAGAPAKPEGGSFYPRGAGKAEIDTWLGSLTPAEREKATGFFTVIRRADGARLTAVPYSLEYQNELLDAAALLREAAALAGEPTLKAYLTSRAAAFLSNDYYESDVAWMGLKSAIEPTIGPYEVYEDALFNYKAAFESFITIRDEQETSKLEKFGAELQGLENNLPIAPQYRNPALGALAPIVVVNEVFAAGDANRGVQTAAFNLPNDDRVIKEKGSKRVMLKNVQEAKFAKVLQPIAGVALAAADRANVSFDAFFTHILMHEIMHGLGPHQVQPGGQAVRLALKDTYSAIEEAKADISGLWALQQLAEKGVVSKDIARTMYTTFLASTFRSIRFGINEAHGKGIALQLNYLLDHGGFVVNQDGTFAVVDGKIKEGVAALTRDLMTLQAEGNYTGAQELLKKMVVVRPEVQKVLDRLKDVPVDIEPKFVAAASLAGK